MAANTIPSPSPESNLTRRAALASTACVAAGAGVLAPPIAAAVAAIDQARLEAGYALYQLERGYERWQKFRADSDAMREREGAAFDRAADRLPEYGPEPVAPPEVARLGKMLSGTIDEARDPTSPVTIPQELLDRYDAHWAERSAWSDGRPTMAGDPDYAVAREFERQREAIDRKADRLRKKLLKVKTTSAKGLLIKLALATDVDRFEDFDEHFRRPSYYGTFDCCEDMMPGLLADLRAMIGRGAS